MQYIYNTFSTYITLFSEFFLNGGENVNRKSIIALLAIFVVIMSASAVCADDAADDNAEDDIGDDIGDDIEDDTGDEIDENETGEDIAVIMPYEDAAGSASEEIGEPASENPTSLSKYPTANPVLALMAALAVLGVMPLRRE